MRSIIVRSEWDPEASVWIATSDDVPGLVTEAETPQALLSKLETMVPELLALNGHSFDKDVEVPLYLMSEQVSRIRIGHAA